MFSRRILNLIIGAFAFLQISPFVACTKRALSAVGDGQNLNSPALPVVCTVACIKGTHCQNGSCVADSPVACKKQCIKGFHCQNGKCVRDPFDKCKDLACGQGQRCFRGRCMRFIKIDPTIDPPSNGGPIHIDDPKNPVDKKPADTKTDPQKSPVDSYTKPNPA